MNIDEFGHINKMMRHAPAFGRRRLCGPDVQAAIDLHGIDRNDLPVEPLREQQSDF